MCLEGWDICHVVKVGQTISKRVRNVGGGKRENSIDVKGLVLYECQELGLENCTRADQDITNINNQYR